MFFLGRDGGSRRRREEELSGRHVLITGGSSGIGLALAKMCSAAGADVTLVARNKEKLAAAATEVEAARKDATKQTVRWISVDIAARTEEVR